VQEELVVCQECQELLEPQVLEEQVEQVGLLELVELQAVPVEQLVLNQIHSQQWVEWEEWVVCKWTQQ
jgi:hypothetical protein